MLTILTILLIVYLTGFAAAAIWSIIITSRNDEFTRYFAEFVRRDMERRHITMDDMGYDDDIEALNGFLKALCWFSWFGVSSIYGLRGMYDSDIPVEELIRQMDDIDKNNENGLFE